MKDNAQRGLGARLRQGKLDLLPVLHELLRTRSVTRTARALGLTQPAVSQALRRLRAQFGDELLVAGRGREARLTRRGAALAAPLQRALGEIDLLLRPDAPFDPATEALDVIVATADYVSVLLAPIVTSICAKDAAQVVVEFVDIAFRGTEDLERVDFFLAPRAFGRTLGKQTRSLPLWQDDIVCVAAADTNLPARITPEQFRRLRQVGYQTNPRVPARIRAMLQPTSVLETSRVCTVADFVVLGALVERSDCVALVPRKLARHFVRWHGLKLVELAYADRHFAIDAYWSPAAEDKRGHGWVRQMLQQAAARLG